MTALQAVFAAGIFCQLTWVGLGVVSVIMGPTYSPIACLHRTGVPCDSPLEGQAMWYFAVIMPGKARRCLFYLISLPA